MHAIYSWLLSHWAAALTALVIVLGTGLNAAARVWRDHTGLQRAAQFLFGWVSLLRRLGETSPIFGKFKLPGIPEALFPRWQDLTADQRLSALEKERSKAGTDPGGRLPVVLALIAGSALLGAAWTGCGSPLVRPRHCKHLLGQDAAGAPLVPWDQTACSKQQTKRDWLQGFTIGLGSGGAASAVTGIILTATDNSKAGQIASGAVAGVLGLTAVLLGQFLATATKNLSDHCEGYSAPRPAVVDKRAVLFLPAPGRLRMRGAEVRP